ncbi:MAG: phage major capsid protein [Chloroflexi bacterium]|nr:MAG: phage major capsid protein [Chloroflexota bacterium]
MSFNNVIGRSDVGGIIPTEYSYELLKAIEESSSLMRMGRRLRDMSVYEEKLPVLSALATAYFPGSDTGLVQSTEVNWTDKIIYAEDVAAIVPISKNVLNDSKIPLWDEVQKELATATGAAIDNAQLYGTNKPSTWPTAIVAAANAAGHSVSLAAKSDLYEAVLGDGELFSMVEQDGYDVDGAIAHLEMKGKLRDTRDANGNPIFNTDPSGTGKYMLGGAALSFPRNGSASSTYKLIAGEWQQLVYSVRTDMAFDVFTEGVIQDGSGNIVFNLMQQRMAAIMITMRMGFQVPNPINRVNETEATRYPFAYLTA